MVNMYCPNCGIETTPDRKFCRSCGMDLITISRVLTGELQVVEPGSGASVADLPWHSQRRGMVKAGFIAFWGGIVLAALFAILGSAVENVDRSLGDLLASLAGLGGLVILVGIGMMVYSLFLSESPAYVKPPRQTRLPNSQPQAQLPPESYRQPVSSVTETTTKLFDEADQKTATRDRARRNE
jgi:zinc-ribbon domain